MTIEDFQLLAWLRVGKAVATIVFYIVIASGMKRVYEETGVSLGGCRLVLRYFVIVQIITLASSVSALSDTLTKPEETIQQYIEQQSRGTSGSLFDVPEELIMGEKSSA